MKNLKQQLMEEAQPKRRGLSFKKLMVNHQNQEFVLREGELEISLGQEIEVLVVSEYGQYYYFDARLERITVLSQIKKPYEIREAVDLKSGMKMKDVIVKLQSQNLKPTYSNILVVLVKVEDSWEEAIFYMKGAVLSSWFDVMKELKKLETTPIGNFVKLTIRPQRKGSVKYATLSLKEYNLCKDEDPLLEKAVVFLNEFKKEVEEYNQYEPVKEPPIEINEEDDDIEF